MNPVAYISVELKARDMDSRLLMAAEAIKRGLHVVYGQQWVMNKNLFSMPEGAVLFKTVNEIQASLMIDAANAGHIVAAGDEEVMACACDDCFESGMGPTASKVLDVFFAQGPQHAATVTKQYPALKDRVRVTGNPRIDLLSERGQHAYQRETHNIRQQVGRYILFNTNFGWINSIWNAREDTKQIAIRSGHLNLEDPESVAAYEAELDWERSNMAALEQVLDWMPSGLPDIKAVIRPHPAEDASYWKEKYQNQPNVLVAEGTPPIPWTLASEVLVHTSCSTGMEAALMGVPAISLAPKPHAALHSYLLTNSVNPTTASWQEATEMLAKLVNEKNGPLAKSSEYLAVLKQYFPNMEQFNSAASIADHVLELVKSRGGQITPDYYWDLRPGHGWVPVDRRSEWKEKFSIETEELMQRLQAMAQLAQLNKSVNIQKLDESLFLLFGT